MLTTGKLLATSALVACLAAGGGWIGARAVEARNGQPGLESAAIQTEQPDGQKSIVDDAGQDLLSQFRTQPMPQSINTGRNAIPDIPTAAVTGPGGTRESTSGTGTVRIRDLIGRQAGNDGIGVYGTVEDGPVRFIYEDGQGIRSVTGQTEADILIGKKLETPVAVEFDDVPLRDVLKKVSQDFGFEITLDESAFASGLLDQNVSLKMEDTTLHSALASIVRDLTSNQLAYSIQNGRLSLSTPEALSNELGIGSRSDLTAATRSAATDGRQTTTLSSGSVTTTPGAVGDAELSGIASRGDVMEIFQRTRTFPVSLDYSGQEKQILEALENRTSVSFPGTPLRDAMQFLSEQHNIPILLDMPALRFETIAGDEQVQLILSNVHLDSALNLLLQDVSGIPLTYIVEDEVLKITTQDRADRTFVTRIYPLAPLRSGGNTDSLIETIRTGVDGEWGDADSGEGTITEYQGNLIIRQTHAAHREIRELLTHLAWLLNPENRPEEGSF